MARRKPDYDFVKFPVELLRKALEYPQGHFLLVSYYEFFGGDGRFKQYTSTNPSDSDYAKRIIEEHNCSRVFVSIPFRYFIEAMKRQNERNFLLAYICYCGLVTIDMKNKLRFTDNEFMFCRMAGYATKAEFAKAYKAYIEGETGGLFQYYTDYHANRIREIAECVFSDFHFYGRGEEFAYIFKCVRGDDKPELMAVLKRHRNEKSAERRKFHIIKSKDKEAMIQSFYENHPEFGDF